MKRKILRIGRILPLVLISFLVSCSDDDWEPLNEIVEEEPEDPDPEEPTEYDWAETAQLMQEDTYTAYLGTNGVFKEKPGNDRFHYWWNAHVLDVLVDGYLRSENDAYVSQMNALVEGIRTHN